MIRIDINNVIASAPTAQAAKNNVGSAKNGVANVRWQIDGRVRSRSNIEARLNNVHYALGQIEAKIDAIKNFAGFAANRYWQTEHYIRMCATQFHTGSSLALRIGFAPGYFARLYLNYLYNRIFGRRGYLGRIVSSFTGLVARWVSRYDKLKLNVSMGAVNIANAGIGVLNGLVKWQNKLAAAAANTFTGAKRFVDASVNDANRFVARWNKEIKKSSSAAVTGAVGVIGAGIGSIVGLTKLFETKPKSNSTKTQSKEDKKAEKQETKPEIKGYVKNSLPAWALETHSNQNYYRDSYNRWGSVAFYNSPGQLSCTYYTLRKLRERGLGFPFIEYGKADGSEWYDNCTKDATKYPGDNALRDIIDKKDLPVENVVLSFSSPRNHVLLIDKIDEDGNITFSDMYPYITDQNGSNPAKTQTIDEFMDSQDNLVGAVIIGSK